jgi:hypothetical protein
MAALTRLGLYGGPRAAYAGFVAASGAAAVSGTATASITEADIVAGGKTIIITLTNDTWVASGATFNAIRQDIIDGLDSAQSELLGWNNEVRDKEVVGAVVRTSDTVVTITLSASPLYDITANETITITVPAAAVSSGAPITAGQTFSVLFTTVSRNAGPGGRLFKQPKRKNRVIRYSDFESREAYANAIQAAIPMSEVRPIDTIERTLADEEEEEEVIFLLLKTLH